MDFTFFRTVTDMNAIKNKKLTNSNEDVSDDVKCDNKYQTHPMEARNFPITKNLSDSAIHSLIYDVDTTHHYTILQRHRTKRDLSSPQSKRKIVTDVNVPIQRNLTVVPSPSTAIVVNQMNMVRAISIMNKLVPVPNLVDEQNSKKKKDKNSDELELITLYDFQHLCADVIQPITHVSTPIVPLQGSLNEWLLQIIIPDPDTMLSRVAEKIINACQMHLDGYLQISAMGDIVCPSTITPRFDNYQTKIDISSSISFTCYWLIRILKPLMDNAYNESYNYDQYLNVTRRFLSSFFGEYILSAEMQFRSGNVTLADNMNFKLTRNHYRDLIRKMNVFSLLISGMDSSNVTRSYNLQIIMIWVILNLSVMRLDDSDDSLQYFSLPLSNRTEYSMHNFNGVQVSLTYLSTVAYLSCFFCRCLGPATLFNDDWTGETEVSSFRNKSFNSVKSRTSVVV